MHPELRTEIEQTVPEHMKPVLIAYINEGRPPSGFLRAVLENKLYEAFVKADDMNQAMMIDYARVLEHMPLMAWGSEEKVRQWINHGGMQGKG